MSDSSSDDPFPSDPQVFDETGDAMAFGYGLGDGFTRVDPRPGTYKAADQNAYYYYPGYIIGYLLKVGALIALAMYGLGGV